MSLRNKILIAVPAIGAALFWYLSAPDNLDPAAFAMLDGDATRGAQIFTLGGCASCHMAKGSKGDARLALGGGQGFSTPFGVFYAPNISPDATGIGGWNDYEFANAVMRGVNPDGQHYYPAFPYSSYIRMDLSDVVDLKAYMDTLPAVEQANTPHELPLPFRLRRGLGLWKLLFLNDAPVAQTNEQRGQYLVEGMGHCAECHTQRNILGGLDQNRWLAGAPNPQGKGRIPNITPDSQGIGDWSVEQLVFYFETGFTPDFDTAGSTMVEVIENLSQVPADDRAAIARYLKSLPALPDAVK